MRSFKEYTPEPEGGKENLSPSSCQTPEASEADAEFGQTATELTKKIAAAWNGKPSGEMLRSILSEAEKSKRAGQLTNAEIDEFYAQFSPLLNDVQRRKLRSVVEKLKRI